MTTTIKLSCVGDVLMWGRQIESARVGSDEYAFDYVFEKVAPHFAQSDLVLGNLETTLSGREEKWVQAQPVRGWPLFNCPDELAGALKRAGFDVLTTANNHCLDRGPDGLRRTLDILDQHGLRHTGTFRTENESQRSLVCDVKGVRVGIAASTFGTNMMPIPDHEPWLVNLLHRGLLDEIDVLKAESDLVVLCLHWGTEFAPFSNMKQRSLAQACFERGADVIFGCHPHVIQPTELRRIRDVHGEEKNRFIIYSLSNFSSIEMMTGLQTLGGVIVNVQVVKDDRGRVEVSGVDFLPTYCNPSSNPRLGRHRVLPLVPEILEDRALSPSEQDAMRTVLAHSESHLVADPRAPRPLWSPGELAALTSGSWKKSPGVRWRPAKVRAPVQNWSDDLVQDWLDDGIVFVRTQKQLQTWFGKDRSPARRATGCLVLPQPLAEHPDVPDDRAILVADNHRQALKALAMHARLRMGGKVVLIVGGPEKVVIRECLAEVFSKRGAVVTAGGQKIAPHLFQSMASAVEPTRFAVFDCTFAGGLTEYQQVSEVLRPDVVLISGFDQAHFDRLMRKSATPEAALAKLIEQQAQLAQHLQPSGAVVLDADMAFFGDIRPAMVADHRVLTYGASLHADVRLAGGSADAEGQGDRRLSAGRAGEGLMGAASVGVARAVVAALLACSEVVEGAGTAVPSALIPPADGDHPRTVGQSPTAP